MAVPPDPAPGPAPGFAFLVSVLLAGQTLGSMATSVLPAMAPRVAATYGIDASLIGYQISILAAAMIISLVFGGNLSLRWGACRVTQVGLGLLIAGSLVAILPHVFFVFASAVALGLGYGLLTPSASHLLARFVPGKKRNFIFSIKQSGVPLGGIGAAVIGPAVAVSIGWQWALAANAAVMLSLYYLLERGRASWDTDRQPDFPAVSNPFGGIATAWNHLALRLLSIAGGALVIVQICITTFTVVLYVEDMKLGLVQAGVVLMASQVGGVGGRVFWGWLADLTQNCFAVLTVLCGMLTAACLAVAAVTPGWPIAASCALFFVLGLTASGWNGAFLAEVAQLAPQGAISSATGGSLFFVNVGKLIGPIAFTNIYLLSGSYKFAFAMLALPSAAALGCLLAARRRGAAEATLKKGVIGD